MATKKYLSLEEAAAILRVQPDELIRLRERGEIRGFADRGTWKFKSEDIEEYGRSRQADSHPDVPILDESSASSASDDAMRSMKRTSDSDVRLILDDRIREGSDSDPEVLLSSLGDSDSDVRLADEPRSVVDSGTDSDVKLIGEDSDSDVTLASAQSDKGDSASDSDVKLIGSDTESDVRLADSAMIGDLSGSGSDSDVQLVGSGSGDGVGRSESDIRLTALDGSSMDVGVGSSADPLSGSSADDVALVGKGSSASSDSGPGDSSVLAGSADSGVGLDLGSSVVLAGDNSSSSDSGISLQSLADSGISLEKADSGIALAGMADSGIALDRIPDSGISLSGPDSGIRLDRGKGKGKDVKGTVPMLQMPDDNDDDLDDTQMEVAALDDDGETYSLQGGANRGPATDADTGVILFDDDDDADAMPAAKSGRGGKTSGTFELAGSSVDFAEAEDFSDDEDLEVAEDVFAEEDQLDELDVFDAADEDFEESFESGESHAEFSAPVSPGRLAAPAAEAEWGTATFVGLALSTLLMSGCLIVTFDLIRSMWAPNQPTIIGGPILDMLKGILASS